MNSIDYAMLTLSIAMLGALGGLLYMLFSETDSDED
jgi:hypothetical protein